MEVKMGNKNTSLLKSYRNNQWEEIEREDKKEFIEECFIHYEIIKILIRLSKDYKLLSIKQYEFAAKELEEIGKLLGGWYKKFY